MEFVIITVSEAAAQATHTFYTYYANYAFSIGNWYYRFKLPDSVNNVVD